MSAWETALSIWERVLSAREAWKLPTWEIAVTVDIHGHRFKIYTLVSEIHENVHIVLGIKNIFELEGVINSRDCHFEFLNRSVPIYPEEEIILKLSARGRALSAWEV